MREQNVVVFIDVKQAEETSCRCETSRRWLVECNRSEDKGL